MKFYLATVDEKRTLYPYEKDIPKGVKTTEIDIPTDKGGLLAAVQELLTEADEANARAAKVAPIILPSDDSSRPLKPTGTDSDGFPAVRTAWTTHQVDSMFKRRSEHVQDICHAISKLKGADLGYIAYQVAAQMVAPVTIIEGGSDG